MSLMKDYLMESYPGYADSNHVRICFFGDLSALSPELRVSWPRRPAWEFHVSSHASPGEDAHQPPQPGRNHPGRQTFPGQGVRRNRKESRSIRPEDLSRLMYSAEVPDPDLNAFGPGGEMRISNFLLWQAAYSEFYFTDVTWPDFDERELDKRH